MKKRVTSRAPINIALIKYWGKKDDIEVLPYQPSISLSLDCFETETTIEKTNQSFSFTINGKQDDQMKKQVANFLSHFTSDDLFGIQIRTTNSGPTAAGLASSASGYAALAVAANTFFEMNYSLDQLASITRKGSGSAIRSLLPYCVKWDVDGSIAPVNWSFKSAKMGIVIISDKKKDISSREAMKQSIKTSPLYKDWVNQSFIDAALFETFNDHHQFSELGLLIENNALMMHKVCETTVPSITFLTDESYQLIHHIQQARLNQTYEAFVTMDAGPNVKILCLDEDRKTIEKDLNHLGYQVIWSNIDEKGAVIVDELSM
ncbi:MAG: diphosphomevalonate decarboxylase [Acholeplasmataceae bacterium]